MSFTLCEYSMLIQGLGVSLFIFSLANHATGVLTVITHPGIRLRYRKKLCRALELQQNARRGRPEEAGERMDEEVKRSRTGEAGTRRGEQGNEERKGRSERKGRYDEGSGAGGLAGKAMGSAMHVELAGTNGGGRGRKKEIKKG